MPIAQKPYFRGSNILEGNGFFLMQWVFWIYIHQHLFVKQRFFDNFFFLQRSNKQPHVYQVLLQKPDNLNCCLFHHLYMYIRIEFFVLPDEYWQQIRCQCRNYTNPKRSGNLMLMIFNNIFYLLRFFQHDTSLLNNALSYISRYEGLFASVENYYFQIFLKLFNLHRQGWLSNKASFSSPSEMTISINGNNVF